MTSRYILDFNFFLANAGWNHQWSSKWAAVSGHANINWRGGCSCDILHLHYIAKIVNVWNIRCKPRSNVCNLVLGKAVGTWINWNFIVWFDHVRWWILWTDSFSTFHMPLFNVQILHHREISVGNFALYRICSFLEVHYCSNQKDHQC